MKTIKSLVLGSAAGLLAMGGAQAADLPVKAKAVEYVRVCSLYGAGFFYIPGTDTCIKLGGYLRVDTSFNTAGVQDQPAWNGDPGQGNRYRDYFSTRSRLALTVDTRTATEYGVVRTFGQADFQFDTLGGATFNPNNLATNLGNNGNLLNSAAAAIRRSKWVSSSSPDSPSVGLPRPMRRLGMVFRATTPPTCLAVMTPSLA
jgi:hypothetical protein